MTQRFDECLKFVLKWEGGYSPPQVGDPNPTNYGITQNTYNAYRHTKNLPYQSVRHITMDEVREIYYLLYWVSSKADKLPPPLDLVHFDTAVNMGVMTANKLLQRSVNALLPENRKLAVDGIVGEKTLSAVKQVPIDKLVKAYIARRAARYEEIANKYPQKRRFLKGWLNRLNDLKRVAGIK